MTKELTESQFEKALATSYQEDLSTEDKIEVLVEIAALLQVRPKSKTPLQQALELYDRALEILPPTPTILRARVRCFRASLLHSFPGTDSSHLEECLSEFRDVLKVLEADGEAEEVGTAHMTIGLMIQSLAGLHKALLTDAISHYQKALNIFKKDDYPQEYAVIHNNLATAYLSIPFTDERGKVREALAVQSFQAALEVVTLEEHPNEYAMLQNNLGNALQYVSSGHALANNLRAIEAYDQALKVRTTHTSPQTYANTIANKANCLRNLPDDPDNIASGNIRNLQEALALYKQARGIFLEQGDMPKVEVVDSALVDIESELGAKSI